MRRAAGASASRWSPTRAAAALPGDNARPGRAGLGGRHVTLLVGAEREGLPASVIDACERTARIPIASESLNAAMAATVALYEMTRGALGRPAVI